MSRLRCRSSSAGVRPTMPAIASKEMFLSCPRFLLGRRREDRLGQLLALAEARRQRHAAHGPGLPILLPARAGQVAAHDALDRHHVSLAHQHGSARPGRPAAAANAGPMLGDVRAEQMVGARRDSRTRTASGRSARGPCPGMPVGKTQSKALMRSVATMTSRSPRS